ncbi:hypothetical protein BD777DRAFT_129592 [Yarrowia lipolytica]|nr:hypothetical protein BD777DRAFT_129592 [Yarrowia lipolytica]
MVQLPDFRFVIGPNHTPRYDELQPPTSSIPAFIPHTPAEAITVKWFHTDSKTQTPKSPASWHTESSNGPGRI